MFIPPIGSSTTTSTTARRAAKTLEKSGESLVKKTNIGFIRDIIDLTSLESLPKTRKEMNDTPILIEKLMSPINRPKEGLLPTIEDAITGLLKQERHDELEREATLARLARQERLDDLDREATRAKLARQERLDRMNRKEAASLARSAWLRELMMMDNEAKKLTEQSRHKGKRLF